MTSDPDSRVSGRSSSGPHRAGSVEAAALSAARELLASDGVSGLTIEGVAARTGIAKTTLYRRWRSKKDLALAVVLDSARTAVQAPARGDIRAALISYLDAAVTILSTTLMGRVMQGLASDLATDPELAAAFHAEVVQLRHDHLAELVRQGIAEGQLRPDTDLALLQDLMFGPVYYRLLFSGQPLAVGLAERIVDSFIPTFLVDPQPAP